jgi:hypothetical protein
MADKQKTYTVSLDNKQFEHPTRWRNGIEFGRGEVKVLELTDEEVENFKNDRYFSIKKGKAKAESTNAGEGEGTVQPEADTTGVDQAPEADTVEDPMAELLQKKRGELEEEAQALGVENPQELPNKTAIAEAIISKRG